MNSSRLPKSFKQYFWDVDFEKLIAKKYPYYIIQRILNFGDQNATEWLFRNFDSEIVKQTLRIRRGFSKRAATYWGKYFKMPKRDIMYFKKGFPNPPERLWPY